MWYSWVFHATETGITSSRVARSVGLGGGGDGGVVLRRFLYGDSPSPARPLTLLYTIFDRKGTPLLYLLLTYPFNYRKCKNHKTRAFPWLFHSSKMHLFALSGLLTNRKDRFSYPFIYFNNWNPYPFIYHRHEKGNSFGRARLGIIGCAPGRVGLCASATLPYLMTGK